MTQLFSRDGFSNNLTYLTCHSISLKPKLLRNWMKLLRFPERNGKEKASLLERRRWNWSRCEFRQASQLVDWHGLTMDWSRAGLVAGWCWHKENYPQMVRMKILTSSTWQDIQKLLTSCMPFSSTWALCNLQMRTSSVLGASHIMFTWFFEPRFDDSDDEWEQLAISKPIWRRISQPTRKQAWDYINHQNYYIVDDMRATQSWDWWEFPKSILCHTATEDLDTLARCKKPTGLAVAPGLIQAWWKPEFAQSLLNIQLCDFFFHMASAKLSKTSYLFCFIFAIFRIYSHSLSSCWKSDLFQRNPWI
jgi:hypothetical protein